jgi:hypothetical protein
MKINRSFLQVISSLIVVLLFSLSSTAQENKLFGQDKKKKEPLLKVHVRKTGPYFGIQQGKYTVGELGGEMQFKRIKLKKPHTHGIYVGGEYNIPNNSLGFNTGVWRKPGRFDFTYGVNLAYRTDFDFNRWGGGPFVGYKIYGFHLMTGYNFLTRAGEFTEVNHLYISLRFTLVNNRDTNFEWRKKEKNDKEKKK